MSELKTKTCKYCNKEFTEHDFPSTFERMVTCASPDCMGERRKERIRVRKTTKLSALA